MPHALPTVEEFYRAMGRMIVRFYGSAPGSGRVLATHAILGCSGLGSIFLNCGVVFGDGPRGEDPAEDRLREFVAIIRERGVGGYVCMSGRIQRRLGPLARELGLEPLPAIPLMARGAAPRAVGAATTASGVVGGLVAATAGAASGGAVERVAAREDLAQFLAVSEAAFDLPADLYGRVVTRDLLHDPGLSMYLVRLEGRAVSCVCVVEDEGLAGISGMATLPELQGRGIGAGLLAAVLDEHRCRAFYLTASAAGQRLYRHHGFETVDAATAWVVPPPHG
jgi:GNAT superfamily N-acetyltransferase